jgi:hypothetical protein
MSILQNLGVRTAQNGKSFASGTVTPADEDVQVTTGLATVDHCGVSLMAAPSVLHTISVALAGTLDGDIQILSYRPTSSSNPTPIASTTEVAVTWWAIGDR